MSTMQRLYLMRHGQTEYNLKGLVQGHCDSPLTQKGIDEAREAARWLADQHVEIGYACSSPLGRAHDTLSIVIDENPAFASVPRADEPGLIERCYGTYEAGPMADMPISPWNPHDELVACGGDRELDARKRIVEALTRAMDEHPGQNVLAVAHGAIITQFKLAWESRATCPQDVFLGNCCILVFDYDPKDHTFTNTRIVNQADQA